MTRADDAVRLLSALRRAGCDTFVDEGEFYCSPPMRHIEWDGDPEEAIEEWRDELRDLVCAERRRVH